MKSLVALMCSLFCLAAKAHGTDSVKRGQLIFNDNFSKPSLSKDWIVESEDEQSGSYSIIDGQLQLNTKGGITVWYKNKLPGNILIEYDRTVMMTGEANDRLSDLNQFWMATDPRQKMFTRKGGFREYDSLRMYYVGMGGNYNSTSRMRRYDGKGTLQVVGEFTDSAHLLKANKTYHLAIVVKGGTSTFYVDGVRYFSFKDERPLTEGWFAIRSTRSRQRIDNVKIYSLPE